MITREFGHGGYAAGCAGNPPPLHVYDTDSQAANWHPYTRPVLRTQPPGPQWIFTIPTSTFGDDPTDPSQQTRPRIATMGMIGRLHEQHGGGK